MKGIYQGKKVLLIGARKSVLENLSRALMLEGFESCWTNNHKNVEHILHLYDASQFDVVAFGRGVSPEDKKYLVQKFTQKNLSLIFVEGLAPITHLLVDQIKLACKPKEIDAPEVELSQKGVLTFHLVKSEHLKVKHYSMNWIYQSREAVLFEGKMETGRHLIPFTRRSGRRFFVLMQKEIVTHVFPLEHYI